MYGLRIERIDMQTGNFGYVISVPKSQTGPHQAPDGKYYKRFNFQSVPMHDYEIRDVMRRAITADLRVLLAFPTGSTFNVESAQQRELSQTFFLDCTVINHSPTPANYAVVEVLVDYDLTNPFALNPFIQVGVIDGPPALKFRIFRRAILSPPELPIFKEGVADTHTKIALQLPSSLLGNKIIYLETKIMAQGVFHHEEWAIFVRGSRLQLIPPGSPMLAK